jgi:hypothetical protein
VKNPPKGGHGERENIYMKVSKGRSLSISTALSQHPTQEASTRNERRHQQRGKGHRDKSQMTMIS